MENLQKIVVLCVVLGIGVLVGLQLAGALPGSDATTEIDPPSLELETGPDDIEPETDGSGEPDVVSPMPVPGEDVPEMIACTMDAKMCPDGSFVGRVGPDCAFAACPIETGAEPAAVTCTEEMKQAVACDDMYAPVCGLVEVQCITEPCNPVPETFSNACNACAQGNVISYTEGQCSV